MAWLLQTRLPSDPSGSRSTLDALRYASLPPYPSTYSPSHFPLRLYRASLHPITPIAFSAIYYLLVGLANSHTRAAAGAKRQPRPDLTKKYKALHWAVVLHNAALCTFSAWVFAVMAPLALDFLLQGWRSDGYNGFKVALCSMPTSEASTLGRFAYVFYLSKMYEVVDSLILVLKGKEVGLLQRYHHAGALISMWIAVRYRSQPVWVFCVFNAGVHTVMYLYYLCSALRIPFPKALKRNLTTLQIAQIASGTILTNLYLLIRLSPLRVVTGLLTHSVEPLLSSEGQSLAPYARARALSRDPGTCLQSTGAILALHVNTTYMLPLLALFAQFFIGTYLAGNRRNETKRVKEAGTTTNGNGRVNHVNGNGNGHAAGKGKLE